MVLGKVVNTVYLVIGLRKFFNRFYTFNNKYPIFFAVLFLM